MLDKTMNIDASGIEQLLANGLIAKPITYKAEDGILAASALVPDGYSMQHLPWERSHPRPFAKRAERTFNDVRSFVEYVTTHAVAGETAVFVTPTSSYSRASVEAVIDDHGKDEAGWGDHRADLDLPTSRQLATWKGYDGKYLGQIEFGEFIEANLADIVEPDAATLLEIVTTLQSTNKVAFESAVRLDNGQVQVKYHEDVSATAGKAGELQIPQTFTIAVPVFEYGVRYAIKARLRYRVREAKLTLAYVLDRVADIERDALATGDESVLNQLRKQLVDVPVYLGSAGSASRYAVLESPSNDD